MEPLVKIENIAIEFQTRTTLVPAVKGVSLELRKGETYGLVGESGCGKSTMAFAAMGYLADNGRVAEGRILYKGRDLMTMPRRELRRMWGREMTMVYQDPGSYLNPSMSIGDQLAETIDERAGRASRQTMARVHELLDSVRFTDPERVATNYPHQLSGGMRQRVCIAMALAKSPDLLIMDEPTTALDVTTEAVVLDLINDLKKKHDVAILYITHDLGVVARICDRVGVMYVGRLVEQAPVRELFHQPSHPYTRGLLSCIPGLHRTKQTAGLSSIPGQVSRPETIPTGCAFAERCADATDDCRRTEPTLRDIGPDHQTACPVAASGLKPGAPVEGAVIDRNNGDGETLLTARNLKHYFSVHEGFFQGVWGKTRKVRAVDDVSLDVARRQTFSIVGESGCGKSTLARVVVGLLTPQQGELTFRDADIAKPVDRRPAEAINSISIVFQNPDSTLNPKHSIGYTIINALKGRRGVSRSGDELRQEAIRYLGMVNLGPHYYGRYPRELSGGEKQRVSVARALASDPELIVCDEPTSALDVSVQAAILTLLLELQDELDLSYLMISHDLSVVHYLSDRIAVMYLGQVCEYGATAEVFQPPYHPYTEALLSAIPKPDPDAEQQGLRLTGRVPSLIDPPPGCRFSTRCPRKIGEICDTVPPPEQRQASGHWIRCHIPLEELSQVEPVTGSAAA